MKLLPELLELLCTCCSDAERLNNTMTDTDCGLMERASEVNVLRSERTSRLYSGNGLISFFCEVRVESLADEEPDHNDRRVRIIMDMLFRAGIDEIILL